METASNKLVALPESSVRVIGKGVIVKTTDKLCKTTTEGGLTVTGSQTKKYDIGEVIAVGKLVEELKIGDVVMYQTAASVAYPLPNGLEESYLTKIDENSNTIVSVVPAEYFA